MFCCKKYMEKINKSTKNIGKLSFKIAIQIAWNKMKIDKIKIISNKIIELIENKKYYSFLICFEFDFMLNVYCNIILLNVNIYWF